MHHSGQRTSWDHPRVCGEKIGEFKAIIIKEGSPPRVRGKVSARPVPARASGITPACAGKRNTSPEYMPQAQDHPRVCGEKP